MPAVVSRISALKSFAFVEERLAGIDCLICRTGYTGSTVGCRAVRRSGGDAATVEPDPRSRRAAGRRAVRLGARDSLRIEAGLPLYGHELDGKFNISPFEAGYGWAVKLDKEFFIGKAAMQHVAETYEHGGGPDRAAGDAGRSPDPAGRRRFWTNGASVSAGCSALRRSMRSSMPWPTWIGTRPRKGRRWASTIWRGVRARSSRAGPRRRRKDRNWRRILPERWSAGLRSSK